MLDRRYLDRVESRWVAASGTLNTLMRFMVWSRMTTLNLGPASLKHPSETITLADTNER